MYTYTSLAQREGKKEDADLEKKRIVPALFLFIPCGNAFVRPERFVVMAGEEGTVKSASLIDNNE